MSIEKPSLSFYFLVFTNNSLPVNSVRYFGFVIKAVT
jgi:hypothetical protein